MASPRKARTSDKLTDWLNKGNSIGTGPYRLTQWDIANEIIIEKNADYWGDAPAFDRIIFRNVADSSTQLQLLETGEADFGVLRRPGQMQQVLDNPGLQLLEGPSSPTNISPATSGGGRWPARQERSAPGDRSRY